MLIELNKTAGRLQTILKSFTKNNWFSNIFIFFVSHMQRKESLVTDKVSGIYLVSYNNGKMWKEAKWNIGKYSPVKKPVSW